MKREIIKEQYPVQNDPVERYLFHGSGGCPCKAIYESTQCGFDHRRSGGGYHGAGFYVSTAAKYSDSYGNEASDSNLGRGKHMFMVRGRYIESTLNHVDGSLKVRDVKPVQA